MAVINNNQVYRFAANGGQFECDADAEFLLIMNDHDGGIVVDATTTTLNYRTLDSTDTPTVMELGYIQREVGTAKLLVGTAAAQMLVPVPCVLDLRLADKNITFASAGLHQFSVIAYDKEAPELRAMGFPMLPARRQGTSGLLGG